MNPIAKEPILVAALASIISWVAAKYAVKVDPQQASEIAGVVLLVAGGFARQLVTPTSKVKDKPPVEVDRVPSGNYTTPPPDPGKRGV